MISVAFSSFFSRKFTISSDVETLIQQTEEGNRLNDKDSVFNKICRLATKEFKLLENQYTIRTQTGIILTKRTIDEYLQLNHHSFVTIHLKLLGGKGGFGSLLKAQGK